MKEILLSEIKETIDLTVKEFERRLVELSGDISKEETVQSVIRDLRVKMYLVAINQCKAVGRTVNLDSKQAHDTMVEIYSQIERE